MNGVDPGLPDLPIDGLDGISHDCSLEARRQCFAPTYLAPEPQLTRHRMARQTSLLAHHRVPLTVFQVLFFLLALVPVDAVFVPFDNCLPNSIVKSKPAKLHFVPLFVTASLNSSSVEKNLTVTVYGNVTGLATRGAYPEPDDPGWSDPNVTLGKIVNVDQSTLKYTTLFSHLDVLSFTPYRADPRPFCDSVVQGECPLGPVFNADPNDLPQLRAFSFSHNLFSTYSFASIVPNFDVVSGDEAKTPLACVTADVTPDLGSPIKDALTYVPLVILILVGVATISAAIYSPWGTTDIFRWTSNYGRDEDLLRLVTPGFGDCLQYIQFVILSGSLTLNYPGFFQPVVSHVGWSVLMFNESLASHGNGTQPLQDGVYSVNGTYGLDRMRQYIGMSANKDVWPGMVVWLLSVLAIITLVTQLAFSFQWLHRKIANVPEEDLRAKNLPFTLGNVIRIVFIYFLLPIVSLSMFQFVIASSSPVSTVALAAVLLVFLILFAGWFLVLIAKTRPRSYLFDDLPTVLLYGPLYNTFSDSAAPFAWISVLLTFIRGIAVGAVQPSGIAQIVLLAICEIILVLTVAAFRPFEYPTSMNAYYTVLAVIKCITILLNVAFVPSLGVSNSTRGWIGYVILVIHGVVLVFGFFLNAIQTLIEVIARLLGAGGEDGVEGGAARGGLSKVFGMRQLSRRTSRRRHIPRYSINSEAAMLGSEMERPSTQLDGERPRSFSGSSAIFLGRSGAGSRMSTGFEVSSVYGVGQSRGDGSMSYTPTTPGTVGAFSGPGRHPGGAASPRGGLVKLKHAETVDHFYRPPRQRRATLDGMSPTSRRHSSWGDWNKRDSSNTISGDEIQTVDGPSGSGRGTPAPAYLGVAKDDPDGDDDPAQPRTDYAVREADFYYRVRGPALSSAPTRKLKTGPADPTGPVSSATGWLRNLFRGKTKEKGRGFEVVRSARAPPPGLMLSEESDVFPEPYRDEPEPSKDAVRTTESPVDSAKGNTKNPTPNSGKAPAEPPSLPPITTTDNIELLSRVESTKQPTEVQGLRIRPPTIPRKSSKRHSSVDMTSGSEGARKTASTSRLSIDQESAEARPKHLQLSHAQQTSRLPFSSKSSSTRSDQISSNSAGSSINNALDEDPTTPRPAHRRMRSSPGRYGSTKWADRPSSLGYVQQHRASDHIHNTDSSSPPFSESTAEIVKDP
ncbi:hypothetical protein D8B26_003806 [Coccidioides posadasii str. Silveira]|uniref:Integral membrane protein n=2 Tax=Coccidioides posadasii TaxID=199306 RepID=E9D8Z3_COCPS|nr:hypothetical protein CPC735_073060 [Coccidioides posadasii C735 delta SOWgp]EER29624.1 hypothetical protein CPC735_073060 [Coccidioides posadasii C735 delta SOWgp]EFW17027.1 integral membrane protein [Coccidioides posadasii str. Silveira]QVM09140.1 hypothetical protein D8B26_003806 [Coccidioides posadasii str. Silveira]|eukprot:XP_003071769.1 hypothetical protein CPC735_073060 [Coccidioides posadasii C735 delta SOWgp]